MHNAHHSIFYTIADGTPISKVNVVPFISRLQVRRAPSLTEAESSKRNKLQMQIVAKHCLPKSAFRHCHLQQRQQQHHRFLWASTLSANAFALVAYVY